MNSFDFLAPYKDWLDIRADPEQLRFGKMFAIGGFKKVFDGVYAGKEVAISVFNGTASSIRNSKRKTNMTCTLELAVMSTCPNSSPGL